MFPYKIGSLVVYEIKITCHLFVNDLKQNFINISIIIRKQIVLFLSFIIKDYTRMQQENLAEVLLLYCLVQLRYSQPQEELQNIAFICS